MTTTQQTSLFDTTTQQRAADPAPVTQRDTTMTIRILPNETNSPAGKLADAELHFTEGPLAGFKLIGFGIWERRTGSGRNVTFPARTYSLNGERRSFALLRPTVDPFSTEQLRDQILSAYAEYEQTAAALTA